MRGGVSEQGGPAARSAGGISPDVAGI